MDADGVLSSTDGVDNRYDTTTSLPPSKAYGTKSSDNITIEPDTSNTKDIVDHEDDASCVEMSTIHSPTQVVGNGAPSYQNSTTSSSIPGSFQAQAVDSTIVPHSRLLSLPPEILIMVMEQLPAMASNYFDHEIKYLYIDYAGRDRRQRLEKPKLTPIAETCHSLATYQRTVSFKDATIIFIHDDVSKTTKFLSDLSRPERSAIKALRIEYRLGDAVNYKAFGELCKIMNTMLNLKELRLTIPVNGPMPIRAPAMPWYPTTLALYKYWSAHYVNHKWNIFRGATWDNKRTAAWVQDLLTVRPGSLKNFEIDVCPRYGSSGLIDWLEDIMLQDGAARSAAVEKLRKSERSFMKLWVVVLVLLIARLIQTVLF